MLPKLLGRFGRHFPAAWRLVEEHSVSGLVAEPGSRIGTSRWVVVPAIHPIQVAGVAAWPASDLLPPSHHRSGPSHASTFSMPRGNRPIQVAAAHVGAAAVVVVVAEGGQWVLAAEQEVAEAAEPVDSAQHSVDELPAGASAAAYVIPSAGKCAAAIAADPLVLSGPGKQVSVTYPAEQCSSA